MNAHALVSAAAGTGKTHTLAGRLTRLIEREGLSAGDDVLVLSFSRAAVAELRRRIGGLAGDARYVGVATFDSFATRILAAAEPAGLCLAWTTRAGSAPRSTFCPGPGSGRGEARPACPRRRDSGSGGVTGSARDGPAATGRGRLHVVR